ncbi:MAG: metal ABC transporter substrate-binding protein [Clostridia bacterium]|nr:metal ABC transporter substrate-binding protein [Clostridia bacterium]
MEKIKKYLIAFIILIFTVAVFTGCSGAGEKQNADEIDEINEDRIKIVATIFPAFDIARHVAGINADVEMLIPPGSEVHSFKPAEKDIKEAAGADLLIYNGGKIDAWAQEVIDEADERLNSIAMIDAADISGSETQAPVKEGEDAKSEESTDEKDENFSERIQDEHVWTSPQNVMKITEKVCESLCEMDPDNAPLYETNAEIYIAELQVLDEDFRSITDTAGRKTVAFADRCPTAYFANEYGLACISPFAGCNGETEPNEQKVGLLTDMVKNENIPVVFYIEFSSRETADEICDKTGAKQLLFHSCHNISEEEFESGETYTTLMRANLEKLKEALN